MNFPVVCIGSVLMDDLFFCHHKIIGATSNPASRQRTVGGVMSNIARHLGMLSLDVELITLLGNDSDAALIKQMLVSDKVKLNHVIEADVATGCYTSVLSPDGSLFVAAVADYCEDFITPDALEERKELLLDAALIVTDANMSVDTLDWLIKFSRANHKKLIIEPVSVPKAKKLALLDLNGVFMITPNEDELSVTLNDNNTSTTYQVAMDNSGIENIWLRKGKPGSIMIMPKKDKIVLDAAEVDVVDSTGAGDAALAGWIKAYAEGKNDFECMQYGHALAYEVLQQKGAVCQSLTSAYLEETIKKYYDNVQ